jgi:uncharacterized membrane protein
MVDQLHRLPGRVTVPLFVRHLVLACGLAAGAVIGSVVAAKVVLTLWELYAVTLLEVVAALVIASLAVSRLVCRRR